MQACPERPFLLEYLPMTLGAGVMYGLLFCSLYFEVFLLVSFLEGRLRRSKAKTPAIDREKLPRTAIIVPCYNESATLESTLRSLLSLEYPKHLLEILIVDDGSTDDTLKIAQRFSDEPQVKIFHKQNGGKHTAMNLGLANTDAELIGCLDADSVVAPDALLRIAPLFADAKIAAVTPGIHVKDPQTMLQHMQHVEYRLSLFNRYITAVLGSVFITPGPFSIFRESVVRELGGWRHAHATEDMEMALRMQEAGHLIANAPKAVVHTSTPRTLRALFKQRVRWTYGWLRNAMDYKHMIGNRRYGNLGIIILPMALISIGTGIFFFARIILGLAQSAYHKYLMLTFTGTYPKPMFDLYYVNTSTMIFLVFVSIALILLLISMGSRIGTGSHKPPLSTPLFLMFYSFLVPLWLGTAVVRAVFNTGVRWR